MTALSPLIQIKNLNKAYGKHVILKNLSFDIFPGEFLTLLGPSGCGKTTLLKIISGFESPTDGEVIIENVLVNNLPPQKRNVHTIFQNYALFPHMNVFENVAFALRCKKVNNQIVHQKVLEALKLVELSAFKDRNIQELSGGQQQRVAIARAIINQPKILLLDEPLSSLDYRLRKKMQIELKNLQKQLNMTFIFVTHDQEEALTMSDRIIIFNQGKIEQIGTPYDIYENPHNLYVAKFIGETNIFNITVQSMTNEHIYTKIAGIPICCKRPPNVCNGDPMHLLVRPENISVYHADQIDDLSNKLIGKIIDITYKGPTIDLNVLLESGQIVSTSEFFDEDHEKIEYKLNEKVYLEWPIGWEVLLPYEH
jgi:spermidine/putrescine transport system ATP-binding protein